ncbi:hypothetical protein [Vibrio sp. 99-70-13A1]|jgi:hypothetical protein|uniref:hypothetical protein n=1 Tax=Vibrio TaxID=662 RepID=UPI0014934339|nr:hypothetical protein [Vibrio sp. 99-70-13A1]NOH95313.1 hypothetical protein [Vibrio sp. 99-70-13A1]
MKKAKLQLVAALLLFPLFSAADTLDSPNRVDAAIYIMHLQINNNPVMNAPFYVGQARQQNKTIDQMVISRVNAHLSEAKFIAAQTNAGPNAIWVYNIEVSNNANGWTALETDLNEQAYITNYCNAGALLANPKLLNSRNQITQAKATNNWVISNSSTNNLVQSAYNPNTFTPIAINNLSNCFTPPKN